MRDRSPVSLPSDRKSGKAEPEMCGEEPEAGSGEVKE